MFFQPSVSYLSLYFDHDLLWLQIVIVLFNLSHDVTSPCMKIDKPLVVYRFTKIIRMNFVLVDFIDELTWTTHLQIK